MSGKGGNMEENTRWQEFNSIIDNEELQTKEKLLLLVIFRYYNKQKGYSYPSKELLKAKCGITNNRDYYKYIKSLENKGLLIKETIVGKGCNFYIIKCEKNTQCQSDTKLQNETNTQCQNDTLPSVKMTPQKENKIKIKEKIYIDLTFIDDVIDKIKITQDQYEKLTDKFGVELINSQILSLDNYIANGKGTKYKDHYRVLNTWCNNKKPKEISDQISITDNGIVTFN